MGFFFTQYIYIFFLLRKICWVVKLTTASGHIHTILQKKKKCENAHLFPNAHNLLLKKKKGGMYHKRMVFTYLFS